MPPGYVHKAMLAFLLLGPDNLSSRPSISMTLYMSPVPGTKVTKRVKEEGFKDLKPSLNQEKLRELQREGMVDGKRSLLFSPKSKSETGSTQDSATTDVYRERNRIEAKAMKLQSDQVKLNHMDILRANYIQEREETEDETERAYLTEKIEVLRKQRQRQFLEATIFDDDI